MKFTKTVCAAILIGGLVSACAPGSVYKARSDLKNTSAEARSGAEKAAAEGDAVSAARTTITNPDNIEEVQKYFRNIYEETKRTVTVDEETAK